MTIAHHDFTIVRTYPYSPEQVYEMFADPSKKPLWFGNIGDLVSEHQAWDFRVGGREQAASDHGNGITTTFDAVYADIVPNERIVFTYAMTLNGAPLSGSATAITFEPVEGGTLLTFTEHGIHLDGVEGGDKREEGTRLLLEQLGKALDSAA